MALANSRSHWLHLMFRTSTDTKTQASLATPPLTDAFVCTQKVVLGVLSCSAHPGQPQREVLLDSEASLESFDALAACSARMLSATDLM